MPSTNFTWSILEYFVSYKSQILGEHKQRLKGSTQKFNDKKFVPSQEIRYLKKLTKLSLLPPLTSRTILSRENLKLPQPLPSHKHCQSLQLTLQESRTIAQN